MQILVVSSETGARPPPSPSHQSPRTWDSIAASTWEALVPASDSPLDHFGGHVNGQHKLRILDTTKMPPSS